MAQNSLVLLFHSLALFLSGRIRRIANLEGRSIENQGENIAPFRKVIVKPVKTETVRPGATFRVRFQFKNLSERANRILSLIPVPMIVAQPGFRSKTWLLGESSGDFMGHYEFDAVEAAEAYWNSLPLRMMRRRAAPGSLDHEIIRLDVYGRARDQDEL